jgi:hypothetical protein
VGASPPCGATASSQSRARILDVPTNRHRELLEGMRHTLARLKTAAEAKQHAGETAEKENV